MFADSILETSWAQRSRRSYSTLASFALQVLIAAVLIMIPLIRPVALPFLKPIGTPTVLTVPPGRPPEVAHASSRHYDSNITDGRIIVPPSIPVGIRIFSESVPPPQIGNGSYLPGATGPSSGRSVPFALWPSTNPMPVPPPPHVQTHPVRISQMSEGDLIRKVQPIYPSIARTARIQGAVVLSAIISKEGTIENLHVLSGHPLLSGAAIEAVRQWRYRPYVLNGEPVEVETQIIVNFSLAGS